MPNEPELRPVASPILRERTIADLCRHFAEDRLTIEEFERRVEIAHTARTEVELKDLVRDLPELAASQPRPAPAATGSLAPASGSARPAHIVAIMSGAERKGGWTPARRTVVTAIMGGVELDFREARLGPGVTELTVVSIMGGVVITVPPDLQVDAEGVPIMGGFQHMHPTVKATDPDTPVLRIRGVSVMGGVEVRIRHAPAAARAASPPPSEGPPARNASGNGP